MELNPYRFYTSEELESMLFGRVKLGTLRKYGLRGMGHGYYGQNVHDALVRFLNREESKYIETDRELDCDPEDEEVEDPRVSSIHPQRTVHPAPDSAEQVESMWDQFSRRSAPHKVLRHKS